MKSTHIDGDDQILSEYLLENGIQVEIVRKKTADKQEFSPLFRQVLGCSSPLLCSVAIGNVIGFTSILLQQLDHDDSPIKITASEESWIASISTVAMAIASICSGILMERYGRKPVLLFVSGCFFVSWMFLSFSFNLYGLLFGRFVTGFCSELLGTALDIYISEITQPSYRGFFLSASGFSIALGILMSHALGIFFEWNIVAVICALLPLPCVILMAVVPESPSWLLKERRIKDAAEAFTWFRGDNSDAVDEFKNMVEGQKMVKLQENDVKLTNILTFARSKLFYKPFSIILLYFATLQSSGPNVISFYTITILKSSLGDGMNEYIATIILDITRVITSGLCCFVVQNCGRRPLTTFSGMTTAATLFGISIYLYAASMNEELKSLYGIPLTLFTLYIIFVTVGLNPLAWTIKSELFPLRYRGTGSSMITSLNSILIFVSVKSTPSLFALFGEQGVFLVFGVCCLIGTILLMIFLPETQNKTLQEIEDSYRKLAESEKDKEMHVQTIK